MAVEMILDDDKVSIVEGACKMKAFQVKSYQLLIGKILRERSVVVVIIE